MKPFVVVALIAVAALVGAMYYKKETQNEEDYQSYFRSVSGGASVGGSSSLSSVGGGSSVPGGPQFYPIQSGSGLEIDVLQKYTIKDFLATVAAKIKAGYEPADAWNESKKNMYVIDRRVELLENAMISDSALHCGDSGCGAGSSYYSDALPGGGSQMVCRKLLNRHVPAILAVKSCSQPLSS